MSSLSKSCMAVVSAALTAATLMACSPEVGSKEWCEDMKQKDKGQWTANDAAAFAKQCVF
ncbi:MAG: DUF3012 domain-containing protein [Acidiferrobacterales bacterium]